MILDIVIRVFNKEKSITNTFNKIEEELKNINHRYVFIDDASTDDTLDIIKKLQQQNESKIKIISLSKTYGKETCIYAGICNTTHELICIYDLDLQANTSYISKMYDYLLKHKEYDQVCMQSNYEEKDFKKKTTLKIYNKLFDININNTKTYYRIIRNNIRESIKTSKVLFTNYILDNMGYNTYYLKFENSNIDNNNLKEYITYSNKKYILFKYIHIFLIIFLFIYFVLLLVEVFKTNYLLILIMIIYSLINISILEILNSVNKTDINYYSIKEKIGFDDTVL